MHVLVGLTGATASVLMAYILPALTFIRLLDNSHELSGPSTPSRQSGSGSDEVGLRRLKVRDLRVIFMKTVQMERPFCSV